MWLVVSWQSTREVLCRTSRLSDRLIRLYYQLHYAATW